MTFKFTKMHGLGNDFIVMDTIRQNIVPTPAQIAHLSQRDTGIGFDQCLLIEASQVAGIDFRYRIFNANGQEVGQCGNGARCLARYVQHYGLSDKTTLWVATSTTRLQLILHQDHQVTVNMGQPQLQPALIPLLMPIQTPWYTIPLPHQSVQIHAMSIGNPHAVLVVDDLKTAPVDTLGASVSTHPLFPEQTNVGFMQIDNQTHIHLRVYERGCGETKACGSGAVAAAVVGMLYHHLASIVTVSLPGGDLIVQWPDTQSDVLLTGPATFVYEGNLCESSF